MYSFAGPRVGDLPFAAEFNQRLSVAWRVVNTEGIVTTVPIATPDLFSSENPHTPFGMMRSIAGNHAIQTYINALKLV
jgi:hypothetical protein